MLGAVLSYLCVSFCWLLTFAPSNRSLVFSPLCRLSSACPRSLNSEYGTGLELRLSDSKACVVDHNTLHQIMSIEKSNKIKGQFRRSANEQVFILSTYIFLSIMLVIEWNGMSTHDSHLIIFLLSWKDALGPRIVWRKDTPVFGDDFNSPCYINSSQHGTCLSRYSLISIFGKGHMMDNIYVRLCGQIIVSLWIRQAKVFLGEGRAYIKARDHLACSRNYFLLTIDSILLEYKMEDD